MNNHAAKLPDRAECNKLTTSRRKQGAATFICPPTHSSPESLEKTIFTSLQSAFKSSHPQFLLVPIALVQSDNLHAYTHTMMTSVFQRNPNKRQVVGKHRAARTLSRSKKAGGGFVSTASTMTNLVLLAFMLLAFSPISSLAEESTSKDALEIVDLHAILRQSKVSSLRGVFLKDRD
jgi:hypothetical protein